MKVAAAVLISLFSLSSLDAAVASKRQPYFRPRNPAANKTKQALDETVVVNAASYQPGVSPGGLATVFGRNLSDVSGVVVAGTDPLPTELAGVSVLVNGIFSPLFSVAFANGEDQISFQVPYDTPTGNGAVEIKVLNHGETVATIETDSFTEDPGIFLFNGNHAVAVHPHDYSLITPDDPASPGEVITLYTTGLGPLSLTLEDGVGAPTDPLAYTIDPFQVEVDGESCRVLFSGLAPGFVGLYQLNVILPSDLPPGDLDIQIFSSYANSAVAKLPVR